MIVCIKIFSPDEDTGVSKHVDQLLLVNKNEF